MSEATDKAWSDEAWRSLMVSVERQQVLMGWSNDRLAWALLAIWQVTPLNTWQSDVLDEAIERLRAWDEPPESIHARIDAAAEAYEPTEEDRAAMDRAWERVKAELDKRREANACGRS